MEIKMGIGKNYFESYKSFYNFIMRCPVKAKTDLSALLYPAYAFLYAKLKHEKGKGDERKHFKTFCKTLTNFNESDARNVINKPLREEKLNIRIFTSSYEKLNQKNLPPIIVDFLESEVRIKCRADKKVEKKKPKESDSEYHTESDTDSESIATSDSQPVSLTPSESETDTESEDGSGLATTSESESEPEMKKRKM